MREFEPKIKKKVFTREFFSKYIYIFVIGLCLLFGVSYSLTFFIQNKSITTGSITTGDLTITFTDRNINVIGMLPPTTDQEGMLLYTKSLTINNSSNIDGKIKLILSRTSGFALTDLEYALIVNGAIQTIDDMPANGEILESAIMGNEELKVELRIWPKTTYVGVIDSFAGEISVDVKYFGSKAAAISNPAGKYVNFNCNGSTCEEWQIVGVEDDRLVLTRQSDYTNATSRTNSNRYDSTLTFNDDSLITSVSTDGKNVYLAKTVKVTGGSGTIDDPYILENDIFNEEDKKVVAVITYKDNNNTTLSTQNVYYNETNYISQVINDPAFQYWDDGTNHYNLGDVVAFTSDTNLIGIIKLPSTLTMTNNSVSLTYGTNGENPYTYNGDGALSCTSGDDTKVTCSVDTVNNKILLTPVAVTTSNVTITISGVDGTNYFAPTSQIFTVSVAKAASSITCNTAQNWTGSNMQSYSSYSGCTPSSNTSVSDANTYTVGCTGDSNHNDSSCSFTINKVASTCPTTSNYSGTYNASSHTINVTAAASGGTTYYRIDGGSWSTTNPAKTNAGTYIVDVKVVGDSNHTDNTSCTSRTISIARKNTTMSISPTSGTVAPGTSTTTTITTDGDGTKSCTTSNGSVASCSVSGNIVTINGIAAGSATITVKQAQGNNYNAATDRTYSVTVSDYGGKKCIRVTNATKLHTETCSQTSNYCKGDGYTGDNTLITYGNAKALNTSLAVGDAFDCDVNGDGIINKDGNGNSTERFYYVSEYYNTDTKSFDTSTGYATLIYYSNTYNNGTSVVVSDNGAAYDSSGENWHGPVTAVTHLPTTTTWSNITLKTTSRTILACDNGNCSNTPVLTTNKGSNTITNPFSYAGRAARLLTLQELKQSGCDTLSGKLLIGVGALKACNFLFEGTKYANSSKATYGPRLETPSASNSGGVWSASAGNRNVYNNTAGNGGLGVRPAIDVPYSQMRY